MIGLLRRWSCNTREQLSTVGLLGRLLFIYLFKTLCTYTVFRKKWYILFLNVTSQLQAQFSYNFQ